MACWNKAYCQKHGRNIPQSSWQKNPLTNQDIQPCLHCLGKSRMLPTAACHLLPFRSQTSHQLPPLLQSQTPFVSHLSLLSMFTTFPDLLSSLEYRAGKVQACWSGQTAENWSKAQNSLLLQCVVRAMQISAAGERSSRFSGSPTVTKMLFRATKTCCLSQMG